MHSAPYAALVLGEPLLWVLRLLRGCRNNEFLKARRVLIVRLDEIGDVLLTVPFLRELRRNLKTAWITLVVSSTCFNLVELCPYVNEVIPFDVRPQGKLPSLKKHIKTIIFAYKHLWSKSFDVVMSPRWDSDYYHSAYVAYFSAAQMRIGYSERVNVKKSQDNCGQDRLFTTALKNSARGHEVERNLYIIRSLGGSIQDRYLEIWPDDQDKLFANRIVERAGVVPDQPVIAFGLGAREERRRWPLERFARLGIWLRDTYNAWIVITGERNEAQLGKEFQERLGGAVINTIGRTTLRQAAAVLKHCSFYIGNDTGTMHLAAAVGLPIIEISCHPASGSLLHANSPSRFGPWGVKHIVLQPNHPTEPCIGPCSAKEAHCICAIGLEDVKNAFAEISRSEFHD